MYIYFDSNGVLREIINDKAVRQGDLNANEVLVYIENVEPADIWITFRKPGGAFSTEKSFITNKITKEIPYNKNRDMRYFKDLTEYTFYKFVISDEITEAGTYEATIRFTYADSLVALGKFVFNAEPSVIKQDNLITQAQYNYLIWYVGSWQGQIGNLASGIATLNSEITTIKSRLDTNEANITNLLSNYVKKTSLTTNSSQSIKPVVNGDFITFEIRNLQSSDNLIKTDNENGIYVSANGVISLVSARIVSDSNLRNAIKGVVYEVGTTKDWQSGTQVNSKITTHDENTTAHAYLRGLINDISQEIARIDARGRSYGELDKTLSELLLESDKDLYIYNYLTNKYSGYENQVGNLIYTKVSDNEPEHELEYNGTNWVDNGAYLISKADNTQFGMVKGDNEYISILNGLIQVLKSDYATRLGTSGANYTYSDLLNTLTQFATDLANRYTKAETLFELEQRITDLLSASVLQDTRITYNGQDTFTYTNQTPVVFPHSVFSEFSWAIMRVEESGIVEYTLLKPAQAVNGIKLELAMFSKDEYASFQLLNGNWQFSVYTKNGNLANTTATLRIWGVKLGNINANEVDYTSDKTVKDALDSLLVPEYITATHEALQTEITATNAFEINDDSGELVKITGNTPTNLVSNSDLLVDTNADNIPDGFTYSNATDISLTNGVAKFTATAKNARISSATLSSINIGDLVYQFCRAKTNRSSIVLGGLVQAFNLPSSNDFIFSSFVGISVAKGCYIQDNNTSDWTPIEVDYIGVYNVSDMISQGVKNDNGIPFADLTNEEIKEQLDIWHEVGYPTHINKLISKSDNLFNGKFNTLTSLASENLISNSDLLIDSNADNIPDGFQYYNATDISLTNGIAKFTATARYGFLQFVLSGFNNQTMYTFARVKADSGNVVLTNSQSFAIAHSGSGQFEFLSIVQTFTANTRYLQVSDLRTSGWTPIDVDYIGAINITDLVSRGILPSGLTNSQYKEMLDNAIYDNVPLRESDFISVEPSVAYRLIKASENSAIHKVIEYTTDNQIVKVNSVDYSGNAKISSPITMNALTRKVKLISDLMDRPTQLLTNPNFDNGTTGWTAEQSSISVSNGVLVITPLGTSYYAGFRQGIQWTAGEEFYNKVRIRATTPNIASIGFSAYTDANRDYIPILSNPVQNQWYKVSGIFTPNIKATSLKVNFAKKTTITNEQFVNERVEVDYRMAYNITDFKKAGVADDNGTLFSRLTNDEIKDQMDIWTEVGFPDHVIAALYPDGADTAISLKYNDADDVFRPQQIDELPLNLTLRSGEYWQDGYVVKQNGNAEYHPLNTKFSAWNYGQLEAVYTSGVPADFDIQYAQNTAAQVKTTQEFVVEAREQLDYVTDGYDNLVEKLGDAIFSDNYDSFAGITSDTYEYYTLEGVKDGNTLAIEGAGQSIQNLLGKGGTINATITTRGITVTYDPLTGVFTANGTATAGPAFNITLATGMDFGLPVGTPMQLMRYYDADDGGTVDLNGSYIGYVLVGTSASNRINENSEALYDPYINGSGNLKPNHATDKQYLVFQVWAPGITFNNFKFKIGIYEGLQLRPFILPSGETAKSNVTIYNRTANMLNMPTALNIVDSGLTITYDPLVQEFLLSGTATATKDISLNATFNALSGDRFSIKRLYQSGDVTAAGGTLPRLKLVNSTDTTIVYNDIYKMTAPEGETPTPDVSFNTGTAPADDTLTLKLGITNGQVFDNYRFRLMIHDKSTDIGYVAYRREPLGNMSVGANERAVIEFKAIPYGILEFVADSESLNLLFADSITDLDKTYLEYNAGIISPNRKISELTARAELIDNQFRNKVIAVWGDSRESNNPTSDPSGVGDQKDTSWPALLAKKLSATVLNYGLSGGAWAENTVQQDAASAIVNRVQTEDVSASADVIIISSMNDFKLASVLGSPLPTNKDKTTFYGAMRLTYERLAAKYPGKKIVLVLPQKRYDETVNYGGGSYYHYLKAQVEVANEYGIPIVDLYNNMPGVKGTAFYNTYMLNDTHWSAAGNDRVAELVARELIGNGNKGNMDRIPPIPTTDGTYTLKVTITGGIPVFSWVAN
jgi:hypothetical protein